MNAVPAPVVSGLPPVIPEECRLLVLGSLPGNRSLAARQYYAHPQNHFWRLIDVATGDSLAALPYHDRLAGLGRHAIGLWDVIATAQRASSLDGDIRYAVNNPLADLVASLPDLRAVACNGALAAKLASRQLAATGLPVIALPSSSPAYTLAFAAKAERWRELGAYLEPPVQG